MTKLSGFHKAAKSPVSIIGAGNTGCALAADLKDRGFAVCLYAHPDHSKRLMNITQRPAMAYSGVIEGSCKPDLMTTDIGEALRFSETVMLALPSYAQEDMFKLLSPYVTNQHCIINLNGNLSSFILNHLMGDKQPLIVETNCAPHASRATEDGDVIIAGVKKFIPIAPLHSGISEEEKRDIESLFPCHLEWHDDILAVSLQAYNGVLHPAPMVMNAARIEDTTSKFHFYAQGISESVGRIVEQIDKERLTIASLYGYRHLRTTLEALNAIYKETGLRSVFEFACNASVYRTIEAPKDMKSRYLSEDVPYILVPWYSLGQRAGFEAKTIRSIIDLSSVMHGTDYLQTGRTIEKMRIASLTAYEQNPSLVL